MRLMIASDIHGSAYYCRKMIEAYRRENADRLLLLGDILYHGPRNALPEEYDPPAVIDMLNSLRQEILCVRGNCDTEVDQMVLAFPILADYCLLELDGRTIFATHGHIHNPRNLPPLKDGDILLNGHTHIPANRDMGTYTYMNPGSVAIPKDGSARGYMIFGGKSHDKGNRSDGFIWKDLDGNPSIFHPAEADKSTLPN